MQMFVVSGRDRKDGMPGRLEHRPAHRAHYSNLDDRLVLSGPYLDAAGEPIGSMIIMKAEDQAAAEAHVAADPYVVHGVFETVTVWRWDWFMKRPEGL